MPPSLDPGILGPSYAPTTGPMCARVIGVCGDLLEQTSLVHVRDQIAATARTLQEPLRVVVAGRVSMGKSTLVNALVGQLIAPTGEAETTKAVTMFCGADFEEVRLHLNSGETVAASLTIDGRLPDAYPVPVEEIQEVHVRLPGNPLLQKISIIDSPGLQSLTESASERSQETFFSASSRAAYSKADALIMVMRAGGMLDDRQTLEAFARLTRGADSMSLNAIGVLSRADECGDPEDPIGVARRMAERLGRSSDMRYHLADVVPVAGRLAETITSGLLTQGDLARLRRLKQAETSDVTADLDGYHEVADEVIPGESDSLVSRLGLVGLRAALLVLDDPAADLGMLSQRLLDLSGIGELSRLVEELFVPRADVLKADHALSGLTRLSYQVAGDGGTRLRNEVEVIRSRPQFHSLRELWALRACTESVEDGSTRFPVPEWMAAELAVVARAADACTRLGAPTGSSVDDLRARAVEGASRAHQFALHPTTSAPQRRVAEVLRTSYSNLTRELTPSPVLQER